MDRQAHPGKLKQEDRRIPNIKELQQAVEKGVLAFHG